MLTDSYTWKYWLRALTRPTTATYRALTDHPEAHELSAAKLMLIAGLSAALVRVLIFPVNGDPVLAVAFIVLLSVIGLILISASTRFFAGALGGSGTYSKISFAFSLFSAPLYAVAVPIIAMPAIRFAIVPIAIYWMALTLVASKAVNRFGWKETIASNFVFTSLVISMVLLVVLLLLFWLSDLFFEEGDIFPPIITNI